MPILVVMLAVLDEIIASHHIVGEHFSAYHDAARAARHSVQSGADAAKNERIPAFYDALAQIASTLMSGAMLKVGVATQKKSLLATLNHQFDRLFAERLHTRSARVQTLKAIPRSMSPAYTRRARKARSSGRRRAAR